MAGRGNERKGERGKWERQKKKRRGGKKEAEKKKKENLKKKKTNLRGWGVVFME